jgi:endonuclease/exonuclease/phosphatase family metal-dependent hydrolase
MRVATFNIESLDEPLGERAALLRPALQRLDADVLCLQEVNGQHVAGRPDRVLSALDALLVGTRYAGYQRAVAITGTHGPADVHNLVTLSRFPILRQQALLHDLLPPQDWRMQTAYPLPSAPVPLRFDRPILITELDLGERRLTVVNLHLRSGLATAIPGGKLSPLQWKSVGTWAEGFTLSGLKRAAQALELRLALERSFDADPSALILVCGDFNAEDDETPLRIVIAAAEDTGNRDLASRALVLLDRSVELSRRFTVLHLGRPKMLDHMLASHALFGHFRELEIHNEALGDETVGYAKGMSPLGSSHAGVVGVFAL